MPEARLRLLPDEVATDRLGISRRTFYRYLKDGTIEPPAGKLAKNRRGWADADIIIASEQIREKEKA